MSWSPRPPSPVRFPAASPEPAASAYAPRSPEPRSPIHMSAAKRMKLRRQQQREEREKARRDSEQRGQQEWPQDPPAGARPSSFDIQPEISCDKDLGDRALAEASMSRDTADVSSSAAFAAPSPTEVMLPFETIRAELLRQVHLEILNGGSFADTSVHLYSRRNRAGSPYAPRVLALNRRILEASSSQFETYVFSETAAIDPDGYVDDSDLEDEIDVEESLPGSLTVTSLPDSFDYQEPETPKTEEDITTRLGDVDLLTDDEEDRHPRPSGTSTPSKKSQLGRASPVQPRILDGAFTTWQSMSLFLYTDHIDFDPIHSYHTHVVLPPRALPRKLFGFHRSSCSPKSMYRLASRLGLKDLQEQAQISLRSYLKEENIIHELFSDFTWRYPDILQMETDIFYRYSTSPSVTEEMKNVFAKIAKGELPHSDIILESLFGKLTQANARKVDSGRDFPSWAD